MPGTNSGDHRSPLADGNPAAQIIEAEIAAAKDFLGEDGVEAAPLLPILHALQAEFGFIDPAHTPQIAEALNISKAEVRGVISFYHDFRSAPAGRKILRLCRAEACQSVGSEQLAAYLASRHGLKPGQTTPDGALTLENVYCLGNCALGPAALLDDDLIGRADEARLDRLLAEART